MITSNEILEKLLTVTESSPLFHVLTKTLEQALDAEAKANELQLKLTAELETKLQAFNKLSELSSTRFALASIFGTPKSVENELRLSEPEDDSAFALKEFEVIVKESPQDKYEPDKIYEHVTDFGNLAIKIMRIEQSLIANEIKELKEYKILEQKYLEAEKRTVLNKEIPTLGNLYGLHVPTNCKSVQKWLIPRLLDHCPKLKEVKVDEDWKMFGALADKCKELRQLSN